MEKLSQKALQTILILLVCTAVPATGRAASHNSLIDSFMQSINLFLGEIGANKIQRKATSYSMEQKTELPYDTLVREAAQNYRLDPCLLHAIIRHESNYQFDAVSPKGAQGLMQLMPATAEEMGVWDSFNPHQNIIGGAKYYRWLLNQFGDHRLALIAYNSGPARVQQGRYLKESQRYANRVIATWNQLYKQRYNHK